MACSLASLALFSRSWKSVVVGRSGAGGVRRTGLVAVVGMGLGAASGVELLGVESLGATGAGVQGLSSGRNCLADLVVGTVAEVGLYSFGREVKGVNFRRKRRCLWVQRLEPSTLTL